MLIHNHQIKLFMNKILLAACLLSGLAAVAQTEKGSTMVGGSLVLQTGKDVSNFTLNPSVGVFAANNFALGAELNLSFSKAGETKINSVGIGPFSRYYFGKTETKPFAITSFNWLNNTTKSGGNEVSTNGFNFLLGMGFAAFVNETVAVEGISGYNYSKYKDVDGSSGFTLRFGFQIYFSRHSGQALKKNVLGQ